MAVSIFHNAKSYYVMKEMGYYYKVDNKKTNIKLFNFSKIFDMNLKKRHYQIIFYVLNKLLEWDCFRPKEKKLISRYKNKAVEKIINENISLIN